MTSPLQELERRQQVEGKRQPFDRAAADDFVAAALHDLKEALRSIRMGAEILSPVPNENAPNGTAPNETNVRGHRFIADGVQRTEMLVGDIAAYCSQNLAEVALERVDLDVILNEAIQGMHDELRHCAAEVSYEPLPNVRGMWEPLTAVFTCLLRNSCRFRSEAPLRIQITAARAGREWVVSVCDNGMGFDPGHAKRIFWPFEKLNGKKFPGSGLGLALARLIVEQHGGTIWAESNLGQGATIKLTLRAVEDSA